jgi:dihydroxyacetone kinase-like protein
LQDKPIYKKEGIMMSTFKNAYGKSVLLKMVKAIQDNKAYLGEVDGLIGDGDHGMNMNKGFSLFETRFQDNTITFSEGLNELGTILFNEIGGSMGPIYGTILMDMGEAGENLDDIHLVDLMNMLEAGLNGLCTIVDAKVGDKTLVDTLSPAVNSLKESAAANIDFAQALEKMKTSAQEGRDSTKDMVAKFGRSSRLGERSRGVLDAGATSCYIILAAMAEGIISVLQ